MSLASIERINKRGNCKMTNPKRVLIIAGCSKKKLPYRAPAIDLNQGQLFRSIKKVALQNHFDLKILSGRFGLLEPTDVITPYNQKIKTKADVERVRKIVKYKITHVWREYDIIITVMGKKYQQVLKRFFDNKFYVVFDIRGIGGYLSTVSHFSRLQTSQLLHEVKKFQTVECAEYLWSSWNFNCTEKYNDPNHPHTCVSCYYNKNNSCSFSEIFPQLYKKYRCNNQNNENIQASQKLNPSQISTSDFFLQIK